MSGATTRLVIKPEHCDRCGRCVRACPKGLVRVTSGYVHIDSSQCVDCGACADVCQTGAITRRAVSDRPGTRATLNRADVPAVVVGSRAEAKALRKAADDAQRQKLAAQRSSIKTAQLHQSTTALQAAAHADGTALWTSADAVIVLVVLAVTLIAKQAVLASEMVALMPASGQVVARALALGAFYSVQAAALAFLASRHGMRVSPAFGLGRLGRSWGHRAVSAGLVILLFVGTRVAALLWGAFAQAIGWAPPVRTELTAVFGAGWMGLALSIAMVVIAAPLIEEMVFRGIVLRAAGQRWGMWPAIAGSATVFALSHATAWALFPALVLGAACGWLTWTRESLWPAIALHALYNGVVVAAAFWLVS